MMLQWYWELACYWYHSNLLSQQRKQSLATLAFLCHAKIFQNQVINLILNIKDKLIATVVVGQVTVSHQFCTNKDVP